jgi:DNA invertase Pin-like site-specific DNA recombinase
MFNMSNEKKLRIAAYIRIGGTGEYASTLELQKVYFDQKITDNPEWELVGIYADVGADSRKQPNLGRLMADCRAGLIDLVITKSVARISRNLGVTMNVVRRLAYLKPPVGILFEDTGMNTLDKDNFMMLTMMEVMAIRESETKNDRLMCSGLWNPQKEFKIKKDDEDETEEDSDEE